MIYLKPDLMRFLIGAGAGHKSKSKIATMQEKWLWVEKPWSKNSKDTDIGDPRTTSTVKGVFFWWSYDKIGDIYFEVCQAEITNLCE